MKFDQPLIAGTLLKRYKRFFVDVALESQEVITAHCPNPGSMLGLKDSGLGVWVSKANPLKERKLFYTLELVRSEEALVGINTLKTNHLLEEALNLKKIPELTSFTTFKREIRYGNNSRIDFLLRDEEGRECYLEVKNVHLKRQGQAQFPDSVTERGTKHLQELMVMVQKGYPCIVVYVVQRDDCDVFSLAKDIDPLYAKTAYEAHKMGVNFLCYACKVSLNDIFISHAIKIEQDF
jgi:sugar fermentation stimulation protein A